MNFTPPQCLDFQSIPRLNLEDFKTEKADFVRRLREVCHHIGFFYIENHGVDPFFTQRMFQLTAAFFDLPQVEKERVNISLSSHFRGYGRLQEEMTDGKPDFKETYDFGLEQKARESLSGRPFLRLHGPNQWPDSPLLAELEWKETVLQYLCQMQELGQRLMAAMSQALGFPESFFAEQFRSDSEDSFALLRLLRYPPSKGPSPLDCPKYGVGPHVDSGCLVILLQDEVGGLQVQNRKGEWIDAPPIPGSLVVNIGKMLQIWSNHYFLATPHRVLNSSSKIRHSIPFFFEPNLTTEVRPLELPPELRFDRSSVKESPVVYGEYMLKVFQRSFPSTSDEVRGSRSPLPAKVALADSSD